MGRRDDRNGRNGNGHNGNGHNGQGHNGQGHNGQGHNGQNGQGHNPYGFLPPELQEFISGGGDYEGQASSMVDWMLSPQLDAIQRAITDAQDQYGEMAKRGSNIYGGFTNEIGDLQQEATPNFDAIQSDYMDQLGDLTQYLPIGGYSPENMASQGVFGAEGAGMAGLLSNAEARNANYNQSAGRQGAIEQRDYQSNLQNNMQDLINQYNQQTIDLEAQKPNLLAQQLMQLKQMGFENSLAAMQMAQNMKASRQAGKSNSALMDYILGQIPGDRRGDRGDRGTRGVGTDGDPNGPGGNRNGNNGTRGIGTNGDPNPGPGANHSTNGGNPVQSIWGALENLVGMSRKEVKQFMRQNGDDIAGVVGGISDFLPDSVAPGLDVNKNQAYKFLQQLVKGTPVDVGDLSGILDEIERFLGLRGGALQNRVGNTTGIGRNP